MNRTMTNEEAIKDIEENILPSVGGVSLRMAIEALRHQERTCGKCACYDRQFNYCNKLGVTFSDDDFCSYFEQKEETENDR